jgi:iron complex transport system permease protein
VPIALAVSLLVVGAIFVITIGAGEYSIAPVDVVKTLLHMETGDQNYSFVVNQLRLPRALVAFMAGAMLALSGAIMQTLTRNPLASPDITGVTAGASLVAVLMIAFIPGASLALLPIGALLGGLLAAACIYLLSLRGGDSPMRMILVGIGLAAVLGAAQSMMMVTASIEQMQAALHWLTGSIYARTWNHFWALLPWFVSLGFLTLFSARHLDVLNLGDDISRGLGMRVNRQRLLTLVAAVGLAAAAVSQVGAIGFVGLVAPHVARKLVGIGHVGYLLLSAMFGGALVLVADFAGRIFFAPYEVPAGIFTALIGAPFFVYLLWRHQERA